MSLAERRADPTAHPITPQSRPLLHELTVSVLWPHRDTDLDFFIGLGQGYLAVDEIGRPMGSAMYFEYGADFAMLGMMTTAPRLQELGTGSWLLGKILRDCAGRDLRLSATRAGYHLYESFGFVPHCKIAQHQGVARAFAGGAGAVRALTPDDYPALIALDAQAFGAPRDALMTALFALSAGVVLEQGGAISGFALCRPFGRGHVVGPVVAASEADARALIAPFSRTHAGGFLRVDTPEPSAEFSAFLEACGLAHYATVTEMNLGSAQNASRRGTKEALLWALAAQSVG